jgi:hypothetical protein
MEGPFYFFVLTAKFLHLEVLQTIQREMFENGLPVSDMTALACNKFKVAGELMAGSIVQGGPAPCFLSEVAYLYISEGIASITSERWYPYIKDNSLLEAIDKVLLEGSAYLLTVKFSQ